MPRYHLCLRGADPLPKDIEDIELPNVEAVHAEARKVARELREAFSALRADTLRGVAVEVIDETGQTVLVVPFSKGETPEKLHDLAVESLKANQRAQKILLLIEREHLLLMNEITKLTELIEVGFITVVALILLSGREQWWWIVVLAFVVYRYWQLKKQLDRRLDRVTWIDKALQDL
jgi:hypothetical protein